MLLWRRRRLLGVTHRVPVSPYVYEPSSPERGSHSPGKGLDTVSDSVMQNGPLSTSDTDVLRGNRSAASGITNEELERQAKSLERATMPNWNKYADWLDSNGRGVDGENSGPL